MTNKRIELKQFLISPAAGKRIIAKSFLHINRIEEALEDKTIVIVAGTTNGYIAEEILKKIGQSENFKKERFFRGITLPANYGITDVGRINDESNFIGDVVIINGKWIEGMTIYDVADSLKKGDIIIKGANALDLENKKAAVYIGDSKAGTINLAMQAVLGRRAEIYIPVGLEKRVSGDLDKIAEKLNSQNATGARLFPFNGKVITEIDAIKIVTGAEAQLVAGGGVSGAEGSYWISISGTDEQISSAQKLIKENVKEPNFNL